MSKYKNANDGSVTAKKHDGGDKPFKYNGAEFDVGPDVWVITHEDGVQELVHDSAFSKDYKKEG